MLACHTNQSGTCGIRCRSLLRPFWGSRSSEEKEWGLHGTFKLKLLVLLVCSVRSSTLFIHKYISTYINNSHKNVLQFGFSTLSQLFTRQLGKIVDSSFISHSHDSSNLWGIHDQLKDACGHFIRAWRERGRKRGREGVKGRERKRKGGIVRLLQWKVEPCIQAILHGQMTLWTLCSVCVDFLMFLLVYVLCTCDVMWCNVNCIQVLVR